MVLDPLQLFYEDAHVGGEHAHELLVVLVERARLVHHFNHLFPVISSSE